MDADFPTQPSHEALNQGRGKNKRFWSPFEDEALMQALHELALDLKWKSENGLKNSYINRPEEMIKAKLPNCELQAIPHIESLLKHWSEKYSALAEMLSTFGFGWDYERKLLQVEKKVYNEWVKTHKKAKGLYGVPFPFYDILAEVYEKDRPTGDSSETFNEAVNNLDVEMTKKAVNLVTDEDVDDVNESDFVAKYVNGPRLSESQPLKKKSKKQKTSKDKEPKKEDSNDLVAFFKSVSQTFQNMNMHLATIASAWKSIEESQKHIDEREQQLHDDINKILDEVMKLEGFSPSESMEATTILSAEQNKIRIFYEALPNFKKQYVLDLLRKK